MKAVRTILLVDDNDDDAFLTRRALKRAGVGCRLLHLVDGQDAIEYFSRQGRYADRALFPAAELVLLDLHMPRVSGFEFLKWLKASPVNPAPLVVVMLSSAQETRDREMALGLGAQAYCVKPPSLELFAALAETHGVQWFAPQATAAS